MPSCERILDTALGRSNASGTAAVSTYQVAVAASISPGNLHYRFRNKEEMIRALAPTLVRGAGL